MVPEHRMLDANNAIHNKTWAQSNPVTEGVCFNGVCILSSSCYFSKKYILYLNKILKKQSRTQALVEGTGICTGSYGWFRGEWVKSFD